MSYIIQLRRDLAANWTLKNSVLASGELGVETDTGLAKLGNGRTAWSSLPYWNPSGASGGGGGGAVSSVFGRTGAVVATPGDYSVGQVSGAAPLASPALTGTPTAPTASALTNSTQVASTAYTDAAVAVEKTRALAAEATYLPLAGGTVAGNLTLSGLLAGSGAAFAVTSKSANYTAGPDDFLIEGNAVSAGFTITLPTTGVQTGQVYVVKKTDFTTNAVTVAPATGQFEASHGNIPINIQYGWVALMWDGSTWVAIGGNFLITKGFYLANLGISNGFQLNANGGVCFGAITTKTGNYTVSTSNDFLILCNATSASFTVTLPSSPTAGQTYVIKRIDNSGNAVTVTPASGTIDGSANTTMFFQYDWIVVQFDGTNWQLIAGTISNSLIYAGGGFKTPATVTAGTLNVTGNAQVSGTTTHTGADYPGVATLTFVASGTTLVNAALGNVFNLTLTASTTTLGNPTNPVDGQTIRIRITQGAGGSFTMGWGTAYSFGPGGAAPTLSTAAGALDVVAFEYESASSTWRFIGTTIGNALQLDGTAADIKPTSTAAAAGAVGKAADAGHVHVQSYLGCFGDGSDGAVTLDGSTAYNNFSSLAGSTYTLTRDVFATNLTVNNGVTLKHANYRIFCQGTCTINGTINQPSNSAAGATAGGASSSGTIQGGQPGAGGATGAGAAGTAGSASVVGAGGTGGTGTNGAGGAKQPTFTNNFPYRLPTACLVGVPNKASGSPGTPTGGIGGSSGGGDGTNSGGGGGSGGNTVIIFAWVIILGATGVINTVGGNGGTPPTGNCGGGGGGSGGHIFLYSLVAWTNSGTTTQTGGTAGSGVGTGTAGGQGGAGTLLNVVLA